MPAAIHINRRVLIGLLAFMLCCNAAVLLNVWKMMMTGRNDFPIFYSNAQMVHEGKASGLYNFQAEYSFTRRVAEGPRPPNNHLPYELLLFIPFTNLHYRTAHVLWTILSLAMLAGVAGVMRNTLGGTWNFALTLLTILAFYPPWYCLITGHDSILLLLLFAVSFWLWKRGRDDMAGFVLALGLFRPQLVLPFVFVALLAGKWKFVRGFLPGAALVVGLSTWVVGFHGMADYARILLSQGTQESAAILKQQWGVKPGLMTTWRGFLWVSLPRSVPSVIRNILLLAGTFLGLGWAAKKLRTARSPAALDVAFAIAVTTVLLVSFHSYVNDFSLMVLPLLICGPVLAASDSVPQKGAYLVLTLGFLLFCTPLYVLLYSKGSLGWLFLVDSLALWLVSRWGTADEAALQFAEKLRGGTERAPSEVESASPASARPTIAV